jgi:hypothetical protein
MYRIIRRTWIAIVLVVITTGCGAHQLKQAQDSYNEAARIEAQASIEADQAKQDPLVTQSLLHDYRIAQSLTKEALEKHETSLRQDQLYGTALMLNALCEWRIVALDESVKSTETVKQIVEVIKERVEAEQITLGTRDRVLVEALPGLAEHALGSREPDPDKAGRLFESALETLENSLKDVKPPADHPVRIYVNLAQLRTIIAWADVASKQLPSGPDKDWIARYERYRKPLEPMAEQDPRLKRLLAQLDREFGYQP